MANNNLVNKIIIFDGVCLLCNKWVDFLVRHDKKGSIKFVALQSELTPIILAQFEYQAVADTIVFLENGRAYTKSNAVIRIAVHLGFPSALMACFYVIPVRFRDKVYDSIARNRYRWFGKKETCRIPDVEFRHRFLDESDF